MSCSTSPSAMTLVVSARISSTRIRVDADHHLERARVEEIADEHGRRVAELGVGGGVSAAQVGLVHDVVVQERRRVDHLDHGRQRVLLACRGIRSRRDVRSRSAGRSRLPPPPMMYSATWRISRTSDDERGAQHAIDGRHVGADHGR